MQLFALLILGGLVGFSSPQFVFGLSPRLDPRRESTLFDELSLEDTTPTDPTITFNSGGLPLDDFLSSATESDLDWLSENVDSNDPDSNNLFSEISYSNEPGASSLFANNDNACNVGIVVDTQLFGKKRREASSCKSTFTGEVENQNGSDGEDGPDRSGESNQESIPQIFPPLSIFPEDFDLCPPRIFKTSNIPVCRSLVEGTYMEIPGQLYVTLLDVKTRRFYPPLALAMLKQRLIKYPQSPRSSSQRCVTIA